MKNELKITRAPWGSMTVIALMLAASGCNAPESSGSDTKVARTGPGDAVVTRQQPTKSTEPQDGRRIHGQSTSGQQPTKSTEPQELKIEVQEEQYPSGQVSQRIEGYVAPDGTFLRHGLMSLFYEDGSKRAEVEFKHGRNHGRRISWYQTGQEWGRGGYVDGLEHGTWTAWWPNGFKQREWEMVHGVWHGTFTEWHDNGEMRMQFEFVNGLKQGPFRVWDDRGNVVHESEFVDDVEQPRP